MESVCCVFNTSKEEYQKLDSFFDQPLRIDHKFLAKNRLDVWTRVNNVFIVKDKQYEGFNNAYQKDEWLSDLMLLDNTKLNDPWVDDKMAGLLYWCVYRRFLQESKMADERKDVVMVHLYDEEIPQSLVSVASQKEPSKVYAVRVPVGLLANYVDTRPVDVYLIHYWRGSPAFVTWVNNKIGFGIKHASRFIENPHEGESTALTLIEETMKRPHSFVQGLESKQRKRLEDGLTINTGQIMVHTAEDLLKGAGMRKIALPRPEPIVFYTRTDDGDDEADREREDQELTQRSARALKSVSMRFRNTMAPIQEQPEILEIEDDIFDEDDVFDWE